MLRQARAIGCRTADGAGMVIAQAALAFEIITGLPANKERMRDSFSDLPRPPSPPRGRRRARRV